MTTLGIVARGLVAACASLTTPCWRALCGQLRTLDHSAWVAGLRCFRSPLVRSSTGRRRPIAFTDAAVSSGRFLVISARCRAAHRTVARSRSQFSRRMSSCPIRPVRTNHHAAHVQLRTPLSELARLPRPQGPPASTVASQQQQPSHLGKNLGHGDLGCRDRHDRDQRGDEHWHQTLLR